MPVFVDCVAEYKNQLSRGCVQVAYRGLLKFMSDLRIYFGECHLTLDVSGGLYPGYMDMTYFSIVTPSLKKRKLKVAVVFLHETVKFEIWLAGANRHVQMEYHQLFKNDTSLKYRVSSLGPGIDSILEYDLVINPDFTDLRALTAQIESRTLKSLSEIERLLASED